MLAVTLFLLGLLEIVPFSSYFWKLEIVPFLLFLCGYIGQILPVSYYL